MSASNDAHSSEQEIVNGRPQGEKELDVESKPKSPCKTDTSVATQTESLSDWFVLLCVFFTNVMNGINYSTYGVLYLPIADMFHATRAAVGWIQSFDFALGTFLGKLRRSVLELVCFVWFLTAMLRTVSADVKLCFVLPYCDCCCCAIDRVHPLLESSRM